MNERISKTCVAQPPPAVSAAKPARAAYKRNLPHIQAEDKGFFITFATWKRWELPPAARDLVLTHCLHDHSTKFQLHGTVVMPEHVHMVFTPLRDRNGEVFGLAEILSGIKGASAHNVNKLLHRKGHVWQDESFDHILRTNESVSAKVDYICQNPVRKGLVQTIDEYPWLWREWIEGEQKETQPGAAVPHHAFSDGNVAQPPPAVSKGECTAGRGWATSGEEA